MSVSQTAGVRAMAKILSAIACEPAPTTNSICESEGLSRSSAFAIVKKLEQAGLVVRRQKGQLHLGPAAIRLGYAGAGLGRIAGPGEAMAAWLRDRTGGSVALTSVEPIRQVLVALPGMPKDTNASDVKQTVCGATGQPAAELLFWHHSGATSVQQEQARLYCERAANTLQSYLSAIGEPE